MQNGASVLADLALVSATPGGVNPPLRNFLKNAITKTPSRLGTGRDALDAPWKIRPLALRSAASLVSPHGSHAHRVRCARAMRARCRAASDRECASRAPCRQGRTGSAGRAADSSSTMPGASSDAMCSVTFRRDAPQPHEVRALASHPCQALLLHLFPRSCVGDSSVRCSLYGFLPECPSTDRL